MKKTYKPRTYQCDECGHSHSLKGGTEPDGTHIPAGQCPIKRRRRSRTKQEWEDRITLLKLQRDEIIEVEPSDADHELIEQWRKGEKPW